MISRVNTNVKNKQTSTIKIHHFSFSYRIVISAEKLVFVDAQDHITDGESGLGNYYYFYFFFELLSFHQGSSLLLIG